MTARRTSRSPRPWCQLHHTNDTRLDMTCPTCKGETHLHEGDLKQSRRFNSTRVRCTKCGRPHRLMPAQGGKRWELAVLDGDSPALQGRLRLGGRP